MLEKIAKWISIIFIVIISTVKLYSFVTEKKLDPIDGDINRSFKSSSPIERHEFSKNNCEEYIENSSLLKSSDIYQIPVETPPPEKDQFEKTQQFEIRRKAAIADNKRLARQAIEKLYQQGPFRQTKSINLSTHYDADKEVISINRSALELGQATLVVDGQKKKYKTFEFETSMKSNPGPLGTKETEVESTAFAFANVFMETKGSSLDIKAPPEVAKKYMNNLQLVFVGDISEPGMHNETRRSDNFNNLEETTVREKYVFMNPLCMAIIDPDSGNILYEFKRIDGQHQQKQGARSSTNNSLTSQ